MLMQMKNANEFQDVELNAELRRAKPLDTFFCPDVATQKRIHAAAKFAGKEISTRRFNGGWKATVIGKFVLERKAETVSVK
jgi:hypothetical protein